MTREQFKEITGEDPEDVLGEDWEEAIEYYLEDSEYFHEGHRVGECYLCKMD